MDDSFASSSSSSGSPVTRSNNKPLTEEQKRQLTHKRLANVLAAGTWKAVRDPRSGKVYYYNELTRTTTWNLIKELNLDEEDGEPLDNNNKNTKENTDKEDTKSSNDDSFKNSEEDEAEAEKRLQRWTKGSSGGSSPQNNSSVLFRTSGAFGDEVGGAFQDEDVPQGDTGEVDSHVGDRNDDAKPFVAFGGGSGGSDGDKNEDDGFESESSNDSPNKQKTPTKQTAKPAASVVTKNIHLPPRVSPASKRTNKALSNHQQHQSVVLGEDASVSPPSSRRSNSFSRHQVVGTVAADPESNNNNNNNDTIKRSRSSSSSSTTTTTSSITTSDDDDDFETSSGDGGSSAKKHREPKPTRPVVQTQQEHQHLKINLFGNTLKTKLPKKDELFVQQISAKLLPLGATLSSPSTISLNASANPICNRIEFSSEKEYTDPDFSHLLESSSFTVDAVGCQDETYRKLFPRNRTQTAVPPPDPTTTPAPEDRSSESLATGSNVALGLGMVASAASAAVVPSMGFGISRQQAMVSFVQNIRSGDCSGVSTGDDESIATADSPTQMKVGSSDATFYVGGTIGNSILLFSLVATGFVGGTLFLKYTGSSSWDRPYSVFARCHVAMILFVATSLLFAPTIKFALVTVVLSSASAFDKIIVVIFGIVFFSGITIYYAVWSLYIRDRREIYHKHHHQKKKRQQQTSLSLKERLTQLYEFWFEGPGEWRMPYVNSRPGKGVTEKNNLDFDAATPMLDGYQGHAWWFGAFEFLIQFGLALASFLANLVPAEKSCVTQAVVLLVVLVAFLFMCVWKRPFQELFNRIVIPVVTLFEVAVVVLALVFGESQPDFVVTLALLAASLQSFAILVVLLVSLSPLAKMFLKVFNRLKNRGKKGAPKSRGGGLNLANFRDAFNDEEEDENGQELLNKKKRENTTSRDRDRSQHQRHHQSSSSSSRDLRNSSKREREDSRENRSSRSAPRESGSDLRRRNTTTSHREHDDDYKPSARPSSSSSSYHHYLSPSSSSSAPRSSHHHNSRNSRVSASSPSAAASSSSSPPRGSRYETTRHESEQASSSSIRRREDQSSQPKSNQNNNSVSSRGKTNNNNDRYSKRSQHSFAEI